MFRLKANSLVWLVLLATPLWGIHFSQSNFNYPENIETKKNNTSVFTQAYVKKSQAKNNETIQIQNLAHSNWKFRKKGDAAWLPATVPGNVHTDLLNLGQIEDPFLQTNEEKVKWVENADWEYECVFMVSKENATKGNVELCLANLDTYGKVFLNNQLIAETNNQFRTWKYDVTKLIIPGKNTLFIELNSSLNKGIENSKSLSFILPGGEALWTRKAQYQYGWDWGPRLITCGIDQVSLCYWKDAKIEEIQTSYKIEKDTSAQVYFEVQIGSNQNIDAEILLHCLNEKSIGDVLFPVKLLKGNNNIKIPFKIPKVELWWTNGLGLAKLYKWNVELKKDGMNIQTQKETIGFRTIEICETTDSIGSEFSFKVNGRKVFMKGANYIPPHSFLNGLNQSKYKELVVEAAEANMNMLRVWGGGVYPADAFFEACDENGILVWQDFMFACAMYPGDEGFVNNVKKEAEDQVKRLRNHPSLAIWCGNNEVDEAWKNWGWQNQYKYSFKDSSYIANTYKKVFIETLADVVKKEDKGRFYWPSSPSIGWGRPQSLRQGDMHYWGVWWGMLPFEVYEQKVGRFMSEYGFQGMPNLNTFKQFMNTKEFDSSSYKLHQKHGKGYETIYAYLERDYKVPGKFDELIYTSQLVQARGMQIAIEAHRRAKPVCMGTLYWQLNDCWPVTSWSSIDYYGRKKAFHYHLKRLYANELISFKAQGDSVLVYVITDKQKSTQGKLKMQLLDFNGNLLKTIEKDIVLEANSSAIKGVWFDPNLKGFDKNKCLLFVDFSTVDGSIQGKFYFSKPKELILPKEQLSLTLIDNKILLYSDVLVKDLYLYSDEEYEFSVNFFDLLPGEKKWVEVKLPANKKLDVNFIKTLSLNKLH